MVISSFACLSNAFSYLYPIINSKIFTAYKILEENLNKSTKLFLNMQVLFFDLFYFAFFFLTTD